MEQWRLCEELKWIRVDLKRSPLTVTATMTLMTRDQSFPAIGSLRDYDVHSQFPSPRLKVSVSAQHALRFRFPKRGSQFSCSSDVSQVRFATTETNFQKILTWIEKLVVILLNNYDDGEKQSKKQDQIFWPVNRN